MPEMQMPEAADDESPWLSISALSRPKSVAPQTIRERVQRRLTLAHCGSERGRLAKLRTCILGRGCWPLRAELSHDVARLQKCQRWTFNRTYR